MAANLSAELAAFEAEMAMLSGGPDDAAPTAVAAPAAVTAKPTKPSSPSPASSQPSFIISSKPQLDGQSKKRAKLSHSPAISSAPATYLSQPPISAAVTTPAASYGPPKLPTLPSYGGVGGEGGGGGVGSGMHNMQGGGEAYGVDVVATTSGVTSAAGSAKMKEDKINKNPTVKPKKFLRKAAGKVWEDVSLAEWPENDYRIFVGDLGNDVNDSTLAKVFVKYSSFAKAKVIRDKRTQKSRGYGFVSFLDPFDAGEAIKEMNGCYIGNRPIKLRKSTWGKRQVGWSKKRNKKHLF